MLPVTEKEAASGWDTSCLLEPQLPWSQHVLATCTLLVSWGTNSSNWSIMWISYKMPYPDIAIWLTNISGPPTSHNQCQLVQDSEPVAITIVTPGSSTTWSMILMKWITLPPYPSTMTPSPNWRMHYMSGKMPLMTTGSVELQMVYS